MEDVAGADEAGETPRAVEGAQAVADGKKPTPGASTEQKTDGQEPTQGASAEQRTNGQEPASEAEQAPQTPGFGERGRMRRRARFLRKARELAYRDLGGLVFDLHRFGQRNDPLVLAKLATLRQIDTEVRELEAVLDDRRPVTVLREVGIAACPRCAAIHGSDDRFCPGCGLAFDAKADRPISTAPVTRQPQASTANGPAAAGAGVAAPAAASAPGPTTASAPSPTTASAPDPTTALATPPAPTIRPTAAPVAAKPTVPTAPARPRASEPKAPTASELTSPTEPAPADPDSAGEDEPTQILRPPASDR